MASFDFDPHFIIRLAPSHAKHVGSSLHAISNNSALDAPLSFAILTPSNPVGTLSIAFPINSHLELEKNEPESWQRAAPQKQPLPS
jgi:hypothetical protein